MDIVTNKFTVRLKDPKTKLETTQVLTAQSPGDIQTLLEPLGQEIVEIVLNDTITEKIIPKDPSDPDGKTELLNSTVQQGNQENMVMPPSVPNPVYPTNYDTSVSPNMNIPPVQMPLMYPHQVAPASVERIIKQGNLKLKLVGDRVYKEDWVKCKPNDFRIEYKGKKITEDIIIRKKDWVEVIDDEDEEDKEV